MIAHVFWDKFGIEVTEAAMQEVQEDQRRLLRARAKARKSRK